MKMSADGTELTQRGSTAVLTNDFLLGLVWAI
jgi:hypothetical protein